MNESGIIQITPQLRQLSIQIGQGYGLGMEEAEDIAQEAMLKLWKVKDDVQSENHARNLTVRITKQLCVNAFRRKSPVSFDKNAYHIAASSDTSPDVALEVSENERWLEQKIKGLSSRLKQVFLLRQTERKSNEEIAQLLDMSPETVATTLSRARRQILEEVRKKRRMEE